MIIEGKYYYLFIEKVELPGVEPGPNKQQNWFLHA